MKKDSPLEGLDIRTDVLDSVSNRVREDSNFRQLLVRIYKVAKDKSASELPDTPISEIICNLFPPELKRLNLRHDEIVVLISLVEVLEAAETGRSAKITQEFLFGNPSTADYWYSKAMSLFGGNQYNNALKAFDKAIQINPKHHLAQCYKGWCLLNLGSFLSAENEIWNDMTHLRATYTEAARCFDRCIDANSKNPDAWHGRGVCLVAFGRRENDRHKIKEAKKCFRKSLKLRPDNNDCENARKWCDDWLRDN